MAFYDVYEARADKNGKVYNTPRVLVPGFGSDYHEGPVSWCPKTRELFVTLSNVTTPDTVRKMFPVADLRLKLAIMKQTGGKWVITEELPFNNKKYHYAHPAISNTGDTLVFSSDMEGGGGNSDLYMSVRHGGQWSAPVNLGGQVNTRGNEMFPAFLPGGLLSFASDGRSGGYGHLDIWYSTFPAAGEIKNAGDKINTQFDDFGLVVHPNALVGYFASDRPGKGSDDIYRVDFIRLPKMFKGKVVDDLTGLPLAGATVNLFDCNGKPVTSVLTDEQGCFRFEVITEGCLDMEASKETYETVRKDTGRLDFVEFRLKQPVGYEILVLDVDNNLPVEGALVSCGNTAQWDTGVLGRVSIPPASVSGCNLIIGKEGYLNQGHMVDTKGFSPGMNRDTVFLYRKEMKKTFALKNINYDFDKWDILPESETELNKLIGILKDNPGLKVELGSHTDSRGRGQYNLWLSQKRSDSAVGYIVSKGIPKSQITAKGYGESQLINRCDNEANCTDWEHRQNRRTEFKIIGFSKL